MPQSKVYWANSLFTEADRRYNEHCATVLRAAGHLVFLAQDAPVNKKTSPMADSIFRADTAAIAKSDVMIACIDQEAIDSGVACEVGIAFELGIPTIGLYTDVRQYRHGPGRMYKNLYVVGAIEANGAVVGSVDEVVQLLPRFIAPKAVFENQLRTHFEEQADHYLGFVQQLESWYVPAWDIRASVDRWIGETLAHRVLEIGCGPGRIGMYVREKFPQTKYLGFDFSSTMIATAKAKGESEHHQYTADRRDVLRSAAQEPFDLAMLLFVLHDQAEKLELLMLARQCLQRDGTLVVVDLTTSDLPRLVRDLQTALARPLRCTDLRLEPSTFVFLAERAGFGMQDLRLVLPAVAFPTSQALLQYMDLFGIFAGLDLPLGLVPKDQQRWRVLIEEELGSWHFPYYDRRVFVECLLR